MEPWELEARESIRETIARYAHAADSGRFAELAACFTPDGVLDVHGEPPLVGRAAIEEFLNGAKESLASAATVPYIRHNVSSVTIDVIARDEARAACYFIAMTELGVDHWGRYRDDFVKHEGAWLFAHRRERTDGRTPGGWAESRMAQ